jgi:hypothetical protein
MDKKPRCAMLECGVKNESCAIFHLLNLAESGSAGILPAAGGTPATRHVPNTLALPWECLYVAPIHSALDGNKSIQMNESLPMLTRHDYDETGRPISPVPATLSRATPGMSTATSPPKPTLRATLIHEYDALDRRTQTTHPDGTTHVGIATGPETSISASPYDGIVENKWGFRRNEVPVIRRCTCP